MKIREDWRDGRKSWKKKQKKNLKFFIFTNMLKEMLYF